VLTSFEKTYLEYREDNVGKCKRVFMRKSLKKPRPKQKACRYPDPNFQEQNQGKGGEHGS